MPTHARPLIMGILNLTPDSFSDGGQFTGVSRALARAREMVKQGADIIDIGGESSRPGAKPVSEGEQKQRVLEVCKALHAEFGNHVTLSIDTTRSAVAAAALDAGVTLVNDISAGNDDPKMLSVCADREVSIVLMHMQGIPETMQDQPHYGNVVIEIRDYLLQRAEAALQAGIPAGRIMIDPGIGFGKTSAHNLALLDNLDELVATGYPVVLGTSRKRFMGRLVKTDTPQALLPATCATTALGVRAGVSVFRVHDVDANRQAADIAFSITHAPC